MNNNSKISVLMTTYNHEKYVKEAINSIISQTYQNFELIIIDDNSTDNTVDIAKSFTDPRIKIITQKNQGPSVAFNTGIRNCSGDYVAFMSGDDVSFEHRLESQLSQINVHHADIIFTRPFIIGPKSESLGWEACPWFFNRKFSTNAELCRILFFYGNCLVATSAFTKRQAIEEIGFFSPALIQLQDFDYWIRAIKAEKQIKLFEEPLIKYRYLYGKNLSGKLNDNRLRIETATIYQNFLKNIPMDVVKAAFQQDLPFGLQTDNVDCHILQSLLLFNHPDPIVKCVGAEKIIKQLEDEEQFKHFSAMSNFNLIDFFATENLIGLEGLYPDPKLPKLRRLLKELKDQDTIISLSESAAENEIRNSLEQGNNIRAIELVKGMGIIYPKRTVLQTIGKILSKFWNVLRDQVAIFNETLNRRLTSIRNINVYSIERAYDYSKRNGTIIYEGDPEEVYLRQPHVIGKRAFNLKEGKAVCPKPYIARLSDVIITGGSDYIITKDRKILNDELVDYPGEEFGIKSPFVKFRHQDKLILGYSGKGTKKIKQGILISSGHDFNYFHWVVECLPKAMFADTIPDLHDIPLLIPYDLHPNLEIALKKCNINNHEIIKVYMGEAYHVEELIFPSSLSRIIDRYDGALAFNKDIVLSSKWINKVSDQIRNTTNSSAVKPWRQLFLTRRRGSRSVDDIEEIERIMLNNGFEIIDLDNVSLDFQLELFSQAATIVSPSGAALTNLIFCPPGTKVLVFMSDHELSNYYLWTQLGDIKGLEVTVLAGERLYNITNVYSVHDDYRINIEALKELITK